MQLIFLLQTAQNGNRILDCGLGHKHRLKAAGQRRVFFDMFAIFIQRGGADTMQLTARQCGLEQVGGVHRAIPLARAHQRVHFVNEQNHATFSGGHLIEHALEALLKFTAIFGAGNQRAHVQRQQFFIA